MRKIYLLIATCFLLIGCTNEPKYEKRVIEQSPQEIAYYENLIKGKSPSEVAKLSVEDVAKKLGGTKVRTKIDGFVTFEEIFAENENVIFNYSLSSAYANLSMKDREKFMTFAEKDLVSRVCSLQTARNSLKHGQREVHRYFYEYPQSPFFELKVDEQICVKAGL